MKIIQKPEAFQKAMLDLRRRGKTIGFVPTMGALHEGHLSLVRQSNKENDVTAVSIFVNPLQFGPKEDFSKYPRVMKEDSRLLIQEKTDFLLAPSPAEMYPEGFATSVEIAPELSNVLCGKFRPGHFNGVATVVAKLLLIAMPHNVYFGAKDFQQCVVVERMMKDLNLPGTMRRMPTVREQDGLAMSSRNRYLSKDERKRAVQISQVLFRLQDEIANRGSELSLVKKSALAALKRSADEVQYLEIVDPKTLRPLTKIQPEMAALTACFVGKTRLIDNVIIDANFSGRRPRTS